MVFGGPRGRAPARLLGGEPSRPPLAFASNAMASAAPPLGGRAEPPMLAAYDVALMARVLILGGGERGRRLARCVLADGNVARVVTRDEATAAEIEAVGAECWVGDPNRLGTVVGALDGVAIVCWLLGCASGEPDEVEALHGALLASFLGEAIDTTMRGFVYEAAGTVAPSVLGGGAATARRIAETHSIPLAILDVPPAEERQWQAAARDAVDSLLGGG